MTDKTFTLTLEKPLYGGHSLGRNEGKAVLVPYGIPGERGRVRLTGEKKDYCFADIEEILSDTGIRVKSECPHFGICGGCSYLHMPYEAEIGIKKTILLDSLSRTAGFSADSVPPLDIVQAERLHYRSHASLQTDGNRPGFYKKGTNSLISIRETGCLLLPDELNGWIRLRERCGIPCRIALDESRALVHSLNGEAAVTEKAGGLTYTREINQFFQANRFLRERMLEVVKTYADLHGDGTFLDIGCGVGFFSLYLAGTAGTGTGIDISRESISWAKKNARLNGIENISFQALASDRIHTLRSSPGLVIIDPPRAGIDKNTRRNLLAMGPGRIVYVSCNPATFSRDAKDLAAGGYRLTGITLIDMFPATHHMEVISLFTR